jgi:hypothetical protein
MTKSLALLGAMLISGSQSAFAMPPSFPMAGDAIFLRVGATDCKGPIATEDHPIFAPKEDPDRLLRMRREGKLPDTFVCGRCEYNIGGDPGAAYYVKTCK